MKIESLIENLRSPDGKTRNTAALDLMDSADPRAVQPLIDAIREPANENNRGTLVYALGEFDCSDHIDLLVDLVLDGNYEVSSCAFNILTEMSIPAEKKVSIAHYLSKIDRTKLKHEHSTDALDALHEVMEPDEI